ncbi:MAG: metallophosphoesterase family protein [Pseudomonadota bacterium]
MKTIGVISDTHGLVRPEAKLALADVDALVHAGDIGKPEVLVELREIAPLTVIRGNVDTWADDLPDDEVLKIEGRFLYVLHSLGDLDLDPKAAGFDVVISGHSHKPDVSKKEGVLYLNPGSAGPKRFTLPVAVAKLFVSDVGVNAEIIELAV